MNVLYCNKEKNLFDVETVNLPTATHSAVQRVAKWISLPLMAELLTRTVEGTVVFIARSDGWQIKCENRKKPEREVQTLILYTL